MITARKGDIHKARPIKWVWSGLLVRDNLNLVIGNEGIGKGTMMAWVLAGLTKGRLPGSMWSSPCNVAIVGTEDDFNDVWVPRVHACGGNLDRVRILEREDFDQIDIRRDIEELAETVQREKIRVLYFDQFLDNLATETDHYHAKQVRGAIAPLVTVAKAVGVTTVATMHPNKRAETFRQLVQGTSAFNAIARSSIYVAEHPDKENVRVLVSAKANYGKVGTGHEFSIAEYVDRPNGYKLKTSKAVSWTRTELTVDDLIESSQHGKKREGVKDHIRALLFTLLGDGAWHDAAEVYEETGASGFSDRTVRTVVAEAGIEARKGGFQGKTSWRLQKTGSAT